MVWLFGALLIVCIIAFWAVGAHSRLSTLRKTFVQAFAQIDAHIKQRHQSILILADKAMELVKTQANVELDAHNTLRQGVQTAHDAAASARIQLAEKPLDRVAMEALTVTDKSLTQSLASLMASNEASTQAADETNQEAIKETFLVLEEERHSLDNRIAFARQNYNQTVQHYNRAIAQFPSNIIAMMFGFQPAIPWQGAEPPVERRQEHRGI